MITTFKRYGFANNSSSSHSIIFAPHLTDITDLEFENFRYNWETFTCASRLAKERYLMVQFLLTVCSHNYAWTDEDKALSKNELVTIFEKIKAHPKSSFFNHLNDIAQDLIDNPDYGVDHQSIITWPVDRITNQVSYDFFFDFSHEVLNNAYVILGGNDNDGDHNLSESGSTADLSRNAFLDVYRAIVDMQRGKISCHKDNMTKEWVISNNSEYSRYNGTIVKAIFGFDLASLTTINMNDPAVFFSDQNALFLSKSSFPYLVDLKITGYCNYDCAFCYTSSTNQQEHASADYIINHVLPVLQKSNVFEVVLGGGEPTMHPRLLDILKAAKKLNFKVGITTKNYQFYKHPNFEEIIATTDSIAISVNSSEELKKAVKLMARNWEPTNEYKSLSESPDPNNGTNWYMQMILGLLPYEKSIKLFKEAAESCFNYITLLGYKNFGFGKNVKSNIVEKNWYNDIRNIATKYNVNVGIDSIIANKHREELINNQIDWNYLVGAEGKQSCYVDCITSNVSASSFTNDGIEKFDFVNSNQEDFLKLFSKL